MTRRTVGALLTAMLLAGLSPITVAAGHTPPDITPSQMILSLPPPTPAGMNFVIGATLTSAGEPVSNGLISLFIDGSKRQEQRSNANGSVLFHRVGNVGDGSYQVTVAFFGEHDPTRSVRPGPASASGTLVIMEAGIRLTVPSPVPAGRKLSVTAVLFTDGGPEPNADLLLYLNNSLRRRARTDATGTARFELAGDLPAGTYAIAVRYLGHRRLHGPDRSIFAIAHDTLQVLPDGISLELPAAAAPGQKLEFSARLYSAGIAVAGVHLGLLVDGRFVRQERTNVEGIASFAVLGKLSAGVHRVTVQYLAPHRKNSPANLVLASATRTIQIRPLILTIQAVPPTSGVTFVIDGRAFTTDSTGVASTTVPTAGIHNLTVRLHDPNAQTHLEFGRWGDDAFTPDRQVRVQGDLNLDAGLRIVYLTQLRFVGASDGAVLDVNRVSNVWLSGPNAETVHIANARDAVWLKTELPVKRSGAGGLYYTATPYTVTSANYDGLSVVDRGKLSFAPGPAVWPIALKLFTMRIHAEDALLGLSIARPAIVTDEVGGRRQVQLDRHGNAVLTVGRGNYTVHVLASGISPVAPVALSKDKQTVVPIISILDLTISGTALTLTLIILLLVGRRRDWLIGLLTMRRPVIVSPRRAS